MIAIVIVIIKCMGELKRLFKTPCLRTSNNIIGNRNKLITYHSHRLTYDWCLSNLGLMRGACFIVIVGQLIKICPNQRDR